MRHTVFAMDTCFFNSVGAYPYEVRCEMLHALGYDAMYLTLWTEKAWADIERLARTKAAYGLDVPAVYATLDIAARKENWQANRILSLFKHVPFRTDVELNLVCSDLDLANSSPEGDERAKEWLEPLLEAAKAHRANVCIYPHIHSWAERVEDGVRLCQALRHPCLKVVFCGFHWYAADGKNLAQRIAEAAPYLQSVNMCGTRRLGDTCTIEPLDCGEMDNFALLGLLEKHGYKGRIGIQGYSVGGDVFSYLRRSLATLRGFEERLEHRPHWARLDFDEQ